VSEVRDNQDEPLSLLTIALPPWFERRTVTIAVGEELGPREASWRDELVSVEAGSLDIVSPDGTVLHLTAGAMLFLDGVAHVALRATGDVPTVLAAVRRRRDPETGPGAGPAPSLGSTP
jgi:hypothetical protein